MDDANEPVWVASKIMTLHHDHVDYRDIAILYRSNFLSRGLEKVLLDFHIPYRIYGGVRFYDRAEIKDALSYLRLLAPFDEQDPKALYKNLAVKRVINLRSEESVQRRWKPSSCRQTMMKRICMMSCANMKSERARQEPTYRRLLR